MTTPLPALGELTIHSNTKELLEHLAEQYRARDVGFAQSRLALDAWANRLAKGQGARKEIELTTPEREVSMKETWMSTTLQPGEGFILEGCRADFVLSPALFSPPAGGCRHGHQTAAAR